MSKPRLLVVVASTRPGRVGRPVADWFTHVVREDGRFDVDEVDLAELNLPFMDEPNHPRFRQYTKQHTRDWSERVDAADAVVFVMPEYNHSYTAPLKNAIDYLNQEWAYKPAGMVSYGGIAGGTRAVQALKPVLAGLKMFPVVEIVNIAWVSKFIDDGVFRSDEGQNAAAQVMLDELYAMSEVLAPRRQPEPVSA
jgi:NAD(P)H-dependent FMN reductase